MRTARARAPRRGASSPPMPICASSWARRLVLGFERAFGVTHDTALSLTQEYRELFDKTVTPSDFPPIDDVPSCSIV